MDVQCDTAMVLCLFLTVCAFEVTSSKICADSNPSCKSLEDGFCTSDKYKEWAKTNCQKHCSLCDCEYNSKAYKHGEDFRGSCSFCTCNNGGAGCILMNCADFSFQLPDPKCMWAPKSGKCCLVPECPAGVTIDYPSWWEDYIKSIDKPSDE